MLSLLIFRLWYLQCAYGSYYRDLSENNRIRTIRTSPPRGIIYDRNEQVLVRNRPAFDLAVILEDTQNINATLRTISEVTGRELSSLEKQLKSPGKSQHFEPRIIISDISREELAKIKVNSYRLPGIIIKTVPTRDYPWGSLAAQTLGYAREISKQQIENLNDKGEDYHIGDLLGQSGLEKQFENNLRGKSGYSQVEVDAMGHRRKSELGIIDNEEGDSLYLTLDLELQKIAERDLEGKRGAVVALDPRNGEVLVLASAPSFDANLFSGKMEAQDWDSVNTNKDRPLNNRAISSRYPPGSTFKLFMALAGLSEKRISVNTEVNCPGYYMFAGRPYKCHKHSGHGAVNLEKAITVSCNVYFYQLGQQLDIDNIEKYGKLFGFGSLTGIEVPGEDAGILPSDHWKRLVHKQKWFPGDTLPVAIGQGYLNITPLQMALGISTIANGGTLYKPFLVKKTVSRSTGDTTEYSPKILETGKIDPIAIETVRKFAINVVNDPRGTGKKAKLPKILVAGKTGTAQVGVLGKDKLSDQFKDHAWFIAYAPAENPSIAMAIIVENSGHGGEFAAPIARDIMVEHFKKQGMLTDEDLLPETDKHKPKEDSEIFSDQSDENLPLEETTEQQVIEQ
ncbi:MAG: penicillin-binding protein 2 [Proteobacteria bacterium]|nr:penicillin-binding protein 2 [Pseudomonadota bacterium]